MEFFRELKWNSIVSLIHPGNIRSIRFAERLGEKLQGQTEVYGKKVLIYGIERADFESDRN